MSPKKIVQDIVPSSKRSIRSIPVERNERVGYRKEIEGERKEKREAEQKNEDDTPTAEPTPIKRNKPDKSKFKTTLTFLIIFICIGAIATALSLLYTKAVITLIPKTIPLNIDGSFFAKKDAPAGSLGYQVVIANGDVSKTVTAVDGPLIQMKAKGTITMFNFYSATSQKISAGTRLSNISGLIYKTTATVTIPARKTVSGKIIPGSVSVGIIADADGANYNENMLDLKGDFIIVSNKGTDKEKTIFGRLKTDIIGGFSGHQKIISSDIIKSTTAELQNSLTTKLLAQISSTIPQGFVMFNSAFVTDYQPISTTTIDSQSAQLSIKGTLYGIIFNSKNLIESLAQKQITNSELSTYVVNGLNKLNFNIINSKNFSPKAGNILNFSLKGPVSIVGKINENDIKNEVLGLGYKEAKDMILKDKSLSDANILLTPFWIRNFPNTIDKITIEYK